MRMETVVEAMLRFEKVQKAFHDILREEFGKKRKKPKKKPRPVGT
jgi:hypothetical protein